MNHKRLLTWFFVAAASSVLFPIHANEASLRQALAECKKEQDTLIRLRCYDAITLAPGHAQKQSSPAAPQAPTKPQAVEQPAPSTPASEPTPSVEERFGKPQQAEANEPDRIYSVVRKIEHDVEGRLLITFENGHTWRQNHKEYYPVNPGETHYIRKALFGSFLLSSDALNRSTRVRRID